MIFYIIQHKKSPLVPYMVGIPYFFQKTFCYRFFPLKIALFLINSFNEAGVYKFIIYHPLSTNLHHQESLGTKYLTHFHLLNYKSSRFLHPQKNQIHSIP